LRHANFSKEDFESGNFARLSVLKKLMSEGEIDESLFWKKKTVRKN
jgi:hypothetical protein